MRPDAVLSNGAIESEEVNVDDKACINSPDVVTSSKNETDDNNNTNGERGLEAVISNKNSKTTILTEKSAQEGEVVANKLKQHAVTINNAVQPKEANTNQITSKLAVRINSGKTAFDGEAIDPADEVMRSKNNASYNESDNCEQQLQTI